MINDQIMLPFDMVKLHFSGPLHLGSGKGEALDKPASVLLNDTLKGALFAKAIQVQADLDVSFFHAFHLSAAIPFYKDKLFFPKPMARLPFTFKDVDGESRQSKLLKRITYVEQPLFEKVLAGEPTLLEPWQLSKGFLWADNSELPQLWQHDVQQRVRIPADRSTEDPKPFYIDRLYFAEHSGLCVLVSWNDASFKPLVETAFQLLGEDGIGTDRNVGNGHFTAEWSEVPVGIKAPDNGTDRLLLGIWLPDTSRVTDFDFLDKSAYQLVTRGGYIAGASNEVVRHLRKRSVRMFDVGSVIHRQTIDGNIIDLAPETNMIAHPVWRDGTTISLPIKID